MARPGKEGRPRREEEEKEEEEEERAALLRSSAVSKAANWEIVTVTALPGEAPHSASFSYFYF